MKKITQLCLLALFLFSGADLMAQPSASAPTPPARSTGKVISIFSDAYTNVTGTDFFPNWGQSTVVSTIQVGADNILKYANLNYQGTQIDGSVNVLPMDKLHVDVWTADGTTFQITPISPGPQENLFTVSSVTQNAWNSYDIDLSNFSNVDMSSVFQFKIVGAGTYYIDNLYFYDSSTTVDSEKPTNFTATSGTIASDGVELLLNATDNSGAVNYNITYGSPATTVTVGGVSGVQKAYTISGLTAATAYTFSVTASDLTGNTTSAIEVNATTLADLPAAPTPTVDASKVISFYSDAYTNEPANLFANWQQSTVAEIVSLSGNAAIKYSNFGYQGIELTNHVDASAMTKVHIDIYPTTETSVRLTPISPGQELPTSLGTLTPDQWNSFDVPLSTYTNVVMSDVFQFKLDGGTGGTFYMDNLYFYDDTNTGIKNPESNLKCFVENGANLKINSSEVISQVSVRSMTGQMLKSVKTNSSDLSVDVSDLSTGNYIVSMQTAAGNNIVRKVVKL